MKYLAVILSVSFATPAMAQVEADEYDPLKAAQLICDVTGVCGEEALEIAMREPESIDDAGDLRRPMSFAAYSSNASEQASRPARAAATANEQTANIARRAPQRTRARVDTAALAAAIIPPEVQGTSSLMVTFANNSSRLTETSQSSIVSFVEGLARIDDMTGESRRFRIEGHTDNSGSDVFNLQLSEQRAQAVVDALSALGVPAERFEVVGMGETQPLNGRTGSDPLNRRVVAVALD